MSLYTGLQIADVHFGAFDANTLYIELHEKFIKYIDNMPILDFICINGDLIDKILSLNSKHALFLMKFMSELSERAISRGFKIRIIKGTESHDNKQLDLLHTVLTGCDYKIINTVDTEYLFPDFKVLYIPEEYVSNQSEYYSEYFNQRYDMIFGHGMIKEASFHAIQQESEITMSSSPIFDSKELLSICDGPIFFGHIHKSQIVRGRFYYVGSFSRWCFGEEDEKGFYVIGYDTETKKYVAEFIENDMASEFNTVDIGIESSLFDESDVLKQLEYIKTIVGAMGDEHIRIKINIPEDYENSELLTYSINTTFNKYKNVKFKIINNTKLRKAENNLSKINLLLDKYGFLFEKSISYEEKIYRFIREKYNRDISIEKLTDYLYNKINK